MEGRATVTLNKLQHTAGEEIVSQHKSNQPGFGGCLFFRKGMHFWFSPVVTQTQEDPQQTQEEEEMHFKTFLLYALREKCFGQEEGK